MKSTEKYYSFHLEISCRRFIDMILTIFILRYLFKIDFLKYIYLKFLIIDICLSEKSTNEKMNNLKDLNKICLFENFLFDEKFINFFDLIEKKIGKNKTIIISFFI